MPPARRKKRLIRWATALVLLALGAYAAVVAVRFVFIYNQVAEAKDLLLTVDATLREEGLGASAATLAEAQSQAMSARAKLRSAQDFLDGEPLLLVAGWLPGLGTQIAAARGLTGIGYEASEIGLAGIAALQALNATKADDEEALGKRVVAFLEAIKPEMTEVEERLTAIGERRDGIESRWLLPPLASLVHQLDDRLPHVEEWLERYRLGQAVAAQLLGFAGPRSYLLLGLDNTELLPGGGLIGAYGLITFDEGQVVQRAFAEVDDLFARWQLRSGGEYVEPPGPLKRYLLRDWTWNFGVANWSPDFPSAARQALFFYDRAGSEPVDGVIALDFAALEELLAVLGPMEVEGYGMTVDSVNVTEEILTHIGKPRRPGEGDNAFANAVAAEVVDRALAVEEERWNPLLETLDRLAREKHLFLYANDPQLQRSLRDLGWAGEVRDTTGDYLLAVDASVHSTKLNLVLDQRIELKVELDAEGGARHTVTLNYENRLAEWARGRDPQVVSDLMLAGFYGGYVRLLAPPRAQLLDLQLNGDTVGVEEITQEVGKASFGRYFPLPRDTRAALRFIYGVPAVVTTSQGKQEYRLLIQKQAGTRALPLRITIGLPAGAQVESVSLDGQRLAGKPLQIQTELSEDRELVVRYEL